MIDRYTRPEMGALWTEHAQFQAWLDVELAACWAWSTATGQIPMADVDALYQNASFDIDRIHEIEAETRHDVVAFTRAVSETLGDERKWVHYGLTSSDVVDTAQSLRLTKANAILRAGLVRLADALAGRAREHKHTVTVGRTHGVHAEPTTFGLKLARFYDAVQRDLVRFDAAAEAVRVGKLSGAVGTFANIPPEVERLTCERLGLAPGADLDSGVAARPARPVPRRARAGRDHHRDHRRRGPPLAAVRGAGGRGGVRDRAEGVERDAAQAEPGRVGEPDGPGAAAARLHGRGLRGRGAVARARHQPLVGREGSSSRTPPSSWTTRWPGWPGSSRT